MGTAKQLTLPFSVERIEPKHDIKIIPTPKQGVYPVRDTSLDTNTEKPVVTPPKVRDDVRVCECCQKQKPLNRDYFHIAGHSEDKSKVYYRRICKVCANAAARKKMKAEAKKQETNVISPIEEALETAQKAVRQAWDDYQMAVDLFRKNIVTSTQHRKIKFATFLAAQQVVKILEAAQPT